MRNCLVHLEEDHIRAAVRNIVASGSTCLAATTFNNVKYNSEPKLADRWRPFNLTLPPFNFPHPLDMLADSSADNPKDAWKYMGVWRVDELTQNYLQYYDIAGVHARKKN